MICHVFLWIYMDYKLSMDYKYYKPFEPSAPSHLFECFPLHMILLRRMCVDPTFSSWTKSKHQNGQVRVITNIHVYNYIYKNIPVASSEVIIRSTIINHLPKRLTHTIKIHQIPKVTSVDQWVTCKVPLLGTSACRSAPACTSRACAKPKRSVAASPGGEYGDFSDKTMGKATGKP